MFAFANPWEIVLVDFGREEVEKQGNVKGETASRDVSNVPEMDTTLLASTSPWRTNKGLIGSD